MVIIMLSKQTVNICTWNGNNEIGAAVLFRCLEEVNPPTACGKEGLLLVSNVMGTALLDVLIKTHLDNLSPDPTSKTTMKLVVGMVPCGYDAIFVVVLHIVVGKTCDALAHFSLFDSELTFVFVDIEGINTAHLPQHTLRHEQSQLILFDSMVHSNDQEYGLGDKGPDGIKTFIKQHTCNSICRAFGLDDSKFGGGGLVDYPSEP